MEAEVQFHTFFISALDGGGWLTLSPSRFTPRHDKVLIE